MLLAGCIWVEYHHNGSLRFKANFIKGIRNGISISGLGIYYQDNGQWLFQIKFEEDGSVNITKEEPDAYVACNEDEQTVEYGHLHNGHKVGLWHKWDFQGFLIEETNYYVRH